MMFKFTEFEAFPDRVRYWVPPFKIDQFGTKIHHQNAMSKFIFIFSNLFLYTIKMIIFIING